MTREPNLTPATFDEWLAGLDVRPACQRPGQWAVNTLPRELWLAVNCTPFDAYHIGERLPDLIRYARHWWGVMECDRDWEGSVRVCVVVAVKRGKVPGDSGDCALDGPALCDPDERLPLARPESLASWEASVDAIVGSVGEHRSIRYVVHTIPLTLRWMVAHTVRDDALDSLRGWVRENWDRPDFFEHPDHAFGVSACANAGTDTRDCSRERCEGFLFPVPAWLRDCTGNTPEVCVDEQWPDRFNRILARVSEGFGTVEEEIEVRRTLFAVDDDHEDDDSEDVEMESP